MADKLLEVLISNLLELIDKTSQKALAEHWKNMGTGTWAKFRSKVWRQSPEDDDSENSITSTSKRRN